MPVRSTRRAVSALGLVLLLTSPACDAPSPPVGRFADRSSAVERIEDLTQHLKAGDKIETMIVNVDRKTRSINLSIKAKDQVEQNQAMQKLAADSSAASSGTTNLGALLKAKLNQQ